MLADCDTLYANPLSKNDVRFNNKEAVHTKILGQALHMDCIMRRKIIMICIPVLLVFVFMFYAQNRTIGEFRINTGISCELPNLNPWDSSIKQYINKSTGANCSKRFNFFYVDEEGVLQLNQTTMLFYNVTSLECVYHVVHRIDDFNISVKDGIPFTAPIFIRSRVFIVACNDFSGKMIYRFVHLNVMWNENKNREQDIGFESDGRLSIIFIGMDSVSRSHAVRSLPKTYEYLIQSMGAFDFKGHMKVGLNTYPNLMPLLTGKPHTFFHPQNEALAYFDNVPFIWTEEPTKSYVLHHNEDRPNIGLFTNDRLGFKQEKIDYSYRLYMITMKLTEPIIIDPLGNSTWACYGNKDHFELQIDYFKRFMKKYSRRLKFALFWNNQQTHDDLNALPHADEPLLHLLKWLNSNGHMKHAIVIVGSDHGFRLGGIAKTYIGRIENNMPFMTISVPKVLHKKYPWIRDILKHNTKRLTSHYDLYETLKQLIYMNFTRREYPNVQESLVKRSLFEKIPENRNCADAGVPENFCSCQKNIDVKISNLLIKQLAHHGMDHINKLIHLHDHLKMCKTLHLHKIFSATFSPAPVGDKNSRDKVLQFNQNRIGKQHFNYVADSGRYTILFYTNPNGGLYEMMLDYRHDYSKDVDELKVIGDPIRINLYENQSHCVHGELLKQICLCNDIN